MPGAALDQLNGELAVLDKRRATIARYWPRLPTVATR
jgi:hypothetical protein